MEFHGEFSMEIHGILWRFFTRVWRVVNIKTLKFRLTFVILLTTNFPPTAMRREKSLFSPLVTVKLKPEIISQGDRELIVNTTILET